MTYLDDQNYITTVFSISIITAEIKTSGHNLLPDINITSSHWQQVKPSRELGICTTGRMLHDFQFTNDLFLRPC